MPRPGRPIRGGTPATLRVSIRITEADKAEITDAALRVGESLSEYLINSAIERARRGARNG